MYLISYDLSSDRIRNKVAKTLENYGRRVQYSVFECRISDSQLNKLYGQLAILLSENEGNVRIYSICAKCEPKLMIIGDESSGLSKEEETIFVI